MAVLTAIAMRQDGTMTALLQELRAMHSQHARLADRVRELRLRRLEVGPSGDSVVEVGLSVRRGCRGSRSSRSFGRSRLGARGIRVGAGDELADRQVNVSVCSCGTAGELGAS